MKFLEGFGIIVSISIMNIIPAAVEMGDPDVERTTPVDDNMFKNRQDLTSKLENAAQPKNIAR